MEPFSSGETVAVFTLEGDQVRVNSARVIAVVPTLDEEGWRVMTDLGTHHVDREGVGATLVPLDNDLRGELAQRGEGFAVVESTTDLDVSLDERLEQLVDFEPPPLDERGRDGIER